MFQRFHFLTVSAISCSLLFAGSGLAQTTELVSVDSLGVQGDGDSFFPAISADGRLIVFQSVATNLVPGDTNGFKDIFLYDRQTGIMELVSVDSFGVQANLDCDTAGISADGRFITFESGASNLVVGDTNGRTDVFLHDRQTGVTERVSMSSLGA